MASSIDATNLQSIPGHEVCHECYDNADCRQNVSQQERWVNLQINRDVHAAFVTFLEMLQLCNPETILRTLAYYRSPAHASR